MEELIEQYRYIALMAGTFFEGETAIMFAATLIHKGLFTFPLTAFFAFLGSFISDWLYYLIGRFNGKIFIDRRPKLKLKFDPVMLFFQKNRIQILFTYRFLYGFRVIIPLIIGMSKISPRHYFFYSLMSGVIWAVVVTTIGYVIGRTFEVTMETIKDNIVMILLGFAAFGLALGYTVKWIVGRSS